MIRAESVTFKGRSFRHTLRNALIRFARSVTKPLYYLYEQRLEQKVRADSMPGHIGLILDGNRRFARQLGLNDLFLGHDLGVEKAHEVLEWCLGLHIPHVTIWVLSPDNLYKRPELEVKHLMELFEGEARNLATHPSIHEHRVRVKAIGRFEHFPHPVLEALQDLEKATADYDGMLLTIAVGYGGREEIADAVRSLIQTTIREGGSLEDLAHTLEPGHIDRHLYTAGVPDPDFIIRTSGEVRLSGFLLWQGAYSEYYFCDAFWPDFRRIDFLRALRSYQRRERRFGV